MINREEFSGTPMFLDFEDGDAKIGFNESARVFTIPANEKYLQEWVEKLEKAMSAGTLVHVVTDQENIISMR